MRGSSRLIGMVLAVLVALAAVSAVAAVYFYGWPLPEPSTADQEGLFRWLVTRDLSSEPAEIRRQLAARLAEECDKGIDWAELNARLTPEYRQRLWDNIPWLLEPWFMAKVDHFHREPMGSRLAYVDRVLDEMNGWSGLDSIRPASVDRTEGDPLMKMLIEHVETWRNGAGTEDRARIDEFLLVVRMRYLLRGLSGAWSDVLKPSS